MVMLHPMSRPKAFDRETALEGAIPVFSDLGYDGTSTEVLLKAMRSSTTRGVPRA